MTLKTFTHIFQLNKAATAMERGKSIFIFSSNTIKAIKAIKAQRLLLLEIHIITIKVISRKVHAMSRSRWKNVRISSKKFLQKNILSTGASPAPMPSAKIGHPAITHASFPQHRAKNGQQLTSPTQFCCSWAAQLSLCRCST